MRNFIHLLITDTQTGYHSEHIPSVRLRAKFWHVQIVAYQIR